MALGTAPSADDALELLLVDALNSDSEASQARRLGTLDILVSMRSTSSNNSLKSSQNAGRAARPETPQGGGCRSEQIGLPQSPLAPAAALACALLSE